MADDKMNKNFGVVLFDDTDQPTGGWACLANSHKDPFRIASVDDLSTGAIWHTNIDYAKFFRGKSEIWRRSNLRHNGYLVVRLDNILKEWNYNPVVPGQISSISPRFVCSFGCQIFQRIMLVAFKLIRQMDPRLTMDRAFTGQTLRDDFRLLLPKLDFPKSDAAAFMQSEKAFTEFTTCNPRYISNAKNVMVRKPRTLHAMEMLQIPTPVGPFEHYPKSQLRKLGSDVLGYLKETNKPCMVELDVERFDSEIGPVYGFSNSSNKASKKNRDWVAHNEFLVLSRYADLTVRSMYVGREYGSLVKSFPAPIQEFFSDISLDGSWTAGVIAETIWRAATMKEAISFAGKQADEDIAQTSWEGAWIRAQDKINMFMSAYELHKRNYPVSSYGLGWIMVRITDEMKADFYNDAFSLGLIPAMVDMPDNFFGGNAVPQWGGDKRSRTLAHMQAAKNVDFLWKLDVTSTYTSEKRRAFITKLQSASAKQ